MNRSGSVEQFPITHSDVTPEVEARNLVPQDATLRVCVRFLNQSSPSFVQYLSPRSLFMKQHIKMPLLMITFATGLSSAMAQAIFKFHGEVLQSGNMGFFSGFELTLVVCGVLQSILTLVLLNVGIQYYEQIDVAPTYQAFLTIQKIIVGLVVLNEVQFYTLKQLLIVALCAGLIVSGILVNLRKSTIFAHSESSEVVSSQVPLLSNKHLQEMVRLEKHELEHADQIAKLCSTFAQ